MIRGSLTTDDWTDLRDYAATVSKFILTDKDSKERISPATFLRLARLQPPDMPLLPSLSDLVIVDADASIAYLDLLLTPSLESLTASSIPDFQQSTFFSFLTAAEKEAPLLQTLILGPGPLLSSSLQTIPQFSHLRHFELKHEDSELPFGFFDKIGSLSELETFILDARYVSSTMMGDKDVNPFPSDDLLNSNVMDGDRNEHGTIDVRHSKMSHTPNSTSGTFNQLVKLHVIGWLPLLEDLISRIMSTRLEDVSLTFIRLSYDELKASLAKEEAEREMKSEENRRREEAEKKMKEQEKIWKDEMERKRIDEEIQWRKEQEQKKKDEEQVLGEIAERISMNHNLSSSAVPPPPLSPPPHHKDKSEIWSWGSCKEVEWKSGEDEAEKTWRHWPAEAPKDMEGAKPKRRATKKGRVAEKENAEEAGWRREVQERLLKERERSTSLFDAHTLSFTELLRQLCCRWTASLKTVTVCQIGESFKCLLQPPTLPEETFRTMLLLPAIKNLEVKGWSLNSVEGVLSAETEPIPNLDSLLLPLASGEANFGISLSTLRRVAQTFPKLNSFQCHIESLSQIPEYPIPTDLGLSHGLRKLSVGNSSLIPDNKQLYLIARHLYLLFPNLETINTSEEHNAAQWVIVDEFIKMFQTARMDDLNRQ